MRSMPFNKRCRFKARLYFGQGCGLYSPRGRASHRLDAYLPLLWEARLWARIFSALGWLLLAFAATARPLGRGEHLVLL